jgi:PPOX class probable F420-dependent enzyme
VARAYRFDELPSWARELLEGSRVARLGLLDDEDGPRVLPVTYAVARGALWSAVDDKPKKGQPARVRYLRRRPHAALTADRYDDDWDRLAWVQAMGKVEILEADAASVGLDALAAKYEQYRSARPAGPVLRLEPERVVCWRAADAAPGGAHGPPVRSA